MKIINVKIKDYVEADPYNADGRLLMNIGYKLEKNSGGKVKEDYYREVTDDSDRIEYYKFKLTWSKKDNVGLEIRFVIRVFFNKKTGYGIKTLIKPINTQLKVPPVMVSGMIINWENVAQTIDGWFKSYNYNLNKMIVERK